MTRRGRGRAGDHAVQSMRRTLIGLVALPLSALPFLAYVSLTPEGRLVRDRAVVALAPPSLPSLTRTQRAAAVARAPRYEGRVMALAYHGIGSGSDAEGGFVISPERFGEHLATLKAAGMSAVTAADVDRAFAGGPPLPPNAVLLSFDDGRTDAMMFADPLLAQARMPATMFVISGAASKPGIYYASWDRIEAYARSGRWDIQSHTASSHREQKAAGGGELPALTSLAPGETLSGYRERVRADLAGASAAIEEHVGRRPVAFAYPFGAYGADRTNDPAIRDVLREEVASHYGIAFHQDDQDSIPLVDAGQDRLGLRRLEVENWSGLELLERIGQSAETSGLPAVPPVVADGVVEPAPVVPLAPGDAQVISSGPPPEGAAPSDAPPADGTPSDIPPPDEPNELLPGVPIPALPPLPGVPALPPLPTLPAVPDLGLPVVTLPPLPVGSPPPPPTTTPTTTRPPTTTPPTTKPPPASSCPGNGKGPKNCQRGGGR